MKSKRYKIPIEIYDCTLYLILTSDVNKTKNNLIKSKDWDSTEEVKNGEARAWFFYDYPEDDIGNYYIILPLDASPALIGHEVSHLALKVLDSCGVDYVGSGESLAYLTELLIDKIWNKVQNFGK
jgi:hypothetical protein